MSNINIPFHPIIYVRGYAMTAGEIDDTTADPFCGFNLGSTVFRAVPDKNRPPRKFIFESPVVRLASDFNYRDVYEDGRDILDPEWDENTDNRLTSRSIIIYRYYDEASRLLGSGERPKIEEFSRQLGELIIRVRDLVCANPENGITPAGFRCYLVAHSMGGLVCRGLLQNPSLDENNARQYVDKLFTYASPHDGIEFANINVPSWFTAADTHNFNRSRMAEYLNLEDAFKRTGSVAWVPERLFPSERIFCMVGTNRQDYVAGIRSFVGHGSDGLVRIENATLRGMNADGTPGMPCAKAFTFRSHSGYFGIVNSEESYQNLTRFLFGDVRVDVWVDVEDIRLPEKVQKAEDGGSKVNGLYQFETIISPRGKLWNLTRRTVEEDSVACLSHVEWKTEKERKGSLFLSSVFLANRARRDTSRPSLAYQMMLGVRVPDYEIDRKFWLNDYYEGSYLFKDSIVLELFPPQTKRGRWKVSYSWQGMGFKAADTEVDPENIGKGKIELEIPFDSNSTPGIKGTLRFIVSRWNPDAVMTE